MVARRRTDMGKSSTPRPAATTPDGRENQLISLANDLAEKRLREGTASAAEVVHLLKLGSSRERLEQERLRHENELTQQKIEHLKSAERMEELYEQAIKSIGMYQGNTPPPESDYDDDYDR